MINTDKTGVTRHIMLLLQITQNAPTPLPDEEDKPAPDEMDKFPDDGEEIENLPPMQPDVHPLERENPDADDLADNEPLDDTEELPEEKENLLDAKPVPNGQTIVVERRLGKDGL